MNALLTIGTIGALVNNTVAPNRVMTAGLTDFSQESIVAGKKVTETFVESNIRYTILTAQMQSGKTTVYYFSGAEMLRLKKVEKVVIFSGNSENDLCEQINGEARKKFFRLYKRYLRNTLGLSADDVDTLVEEIDEKIQVIWGAHKLSTNKCNRTDTFYIWDESHFAQNNTMKPAEFLRFAGVSADGDPANLERQNNYFLSVSATPFSEVSDVKHMDQFKRIVRLEAGEGYHSVEKMLTTGKIIPFDNWKTGLHDAFTNVPRDAKKYALVIKKF